MARRPRSSVPMEPRGSIEADPRVQFLPVPNARRLVIVDDFSAVPASAFDGALVWVRPPTDCTDEQVLAVAETLKLAGAAAVRLLPRQAEDAVLPAEAGSAAAQSTVSEVRPVVVELIAELPEALRASVTDYVEELLASEGL